MQLIYTMTPNSEAIKDIHIFNELETAIKLIEIGFGEYQNLEIGNLFYHLPFQLISSGLERLMKCYICFGFHEKNNRYPNYKELRKASGSNGHDLLELKKTILAEYFHAGQNTFLLKDLQLLSEDQSLERLIYLLSEFGKFARYYNLDVVTENEKPSIDVKSRWEEYEFNLLSNMPELREKLYQSHTEKEPLSYIRREVIIKLEQFVSALCTQFTLGKLGKKAKVSSVIVSRFRSLRAEELGSRDYRMKSTRFTQQKVTPHKRTFIDELQRKNSPDYVSKKIKKSEFEGDWPFYANEVIIECRQEHWCVITIDKVDYALNGSASGRYKLEYPDDAGMAIPGVSYQQFIGLALELGSQKQTSSNDDDDELAPA